MSHITPERQQILDLLSDGGSHSPDQIAATLGKKPNSINKLMLKLLDNGLVYQPSYGAYALPSTDSDPVVPQDVPRIHADPGVYVLRNGPYYKIGKSRNVAWRVQQLKVALPQETFHVHTIETDEPDELERQLHLRYAAKRVRGEWFELDMFDVDELCEMGSEHN